MQEIFKYLAQIQQKLDCEIVERQQRAGQICEDVDSSRHQEELYHDYHEPMIRRSREAISHQQQQVIMKQVASGQKNNNMSQGTTSTLFWDT